MFTKKFLEAIEPNGKQQSFKDEKVAGLILLVSPKGAKTFYSYRWINGGPERIKIGSFATTTIDEARRAAAKINGAIASDHNPAAAKRVLKAEPTFAEMLEEYLKKKRSRSGKPLAPYTQETYRALTVNYLGSISKLKLSQITPDSLRRIKIHSDATNNRARAVVSAVYTWANDEGLTTAPNPAKAIKTRLIKSRERFLLPSELPRFFEALDKSEWRDFFLMALYTGARKSNVQAMAWADINLEERVWTIAKTKNGDSQTITLTPEAVEILKERRKQKIVSAKWVFPGIGKTGHLVEPKKAWANILKEAKIEGLRIHDLRRTLGSWQARAGASLTLIGKSLGHRSQQATVIYSRLDLDPVRESVESAVSEMIKAGRKGG